MKMSSLSVNPRSDGKEIKIMKNEYESAAVTVIGNAQEVILGTKEDIRRDSPEDPFLNIMDDDE
jgi:hypothetical protein